LSKQKDFSKQKKKEVNSFILSALINYL